MQNPRIAKIMQLCPNKPKFRNGSNIINSRTLEKVNDCPKVYSKIRTTSASPSSSRKVVQAQNTREHSRNKRLCDNADLFELPVSYDDFPILRSMETETSHDIITNPRFDLSMFENCNFGKNDNGASAEFAQPFSSPPIANAAAFINPVPSTSSNKENIPTLKRINSNESSVHNNEIENSDMRTCSTSHQMDSNLTENNTLENFSPIFPGFDSDDSILDKDYLPSDSPSDMEIDEIDLRHRIEHTVEGSSENSTNESLEVMRTNHLNIQQHTDEPLDVLLENNTNAMRNNHLYLQQHSEQTLNDLLDNNTNESDEVVPMPTEEPTPSTSNYTKKGTLRKRKRYTESLRTRKEKQKQLQKTKYVVKSGCRPLICKKKCTESFTENMRQKINKKFWDLDFGERQQFIKNLCTATPPQRTNKNTSRKKFSFKYFLKNADSTNIPVCKEFFLTTLGFKKNNDKMLYNALTSIEKKEDKRGKHAKCVPLDKKILEVHISSYNPTISHHRREHAPKRSYLPSDITITDMHINFMEKHPELKVSYEMYRKKVKEMNISFAKLGCEECGSCETFSLHNPSHKENNMEPDCDDCIKWDQHLKKAAAAREIYTAHKEKTDDPDHVYVSADLQKVIMLPRMDNFKEVVFCPRLIVLNESFVPLGKSKRFPFAALWHEAISGRKKEDIISTYHAFFLAHKNFKNIDIWLDNCSGQNKNWLLYNYIVYIINSNNIGTENIVLNYLVSGHTFMSADSFHHQVELSMGKKQKLYDFSDFVECVQNANSRKVDIKIMNVDDFFNCTDYVSERKLKNNSLRPYLSEMVQVRFTRGKFTAEYKTDYSGEYIEFNFLKDNFIKAKGNLDMMAPHTVCRGIDSGRKNNLIKKIGPLMPPHYLKFWEELVVSTMTNKRSLDD